MAPATKVHNSNHPNMNRWDNRPINNNSNKNIPSSTSSLSSSASSSSSSASCASSCDDDHHHHHHHHNSTTTVATDSGSNSRRCSNASPNDVMLHHDSFHNRSMTSLANYDDIFSTTGYSYGHQSYNNNNNSFHHHNNSASHNLGIVSHRAVLIRTGNALYDDIEYYEYTLPHSSSSSMTMGRPPRTPKTPGGRATAVVMSDFAMSAYLTASPF